MNNNLNALSYSPLTIPCHGSLCSYGINFSLSGNLNQSIIIQILFDDYVLGSHSGGVDISNQVADSVHRS